VLLDIGMPKLTGYELVFSDFLSLSKRNRPLLVAVTARGRESDKLRAQIAGFDHHFSKPVAPEAILKLLERCKANRCHEESPSSTTIVRQRIHSRAGLTLKAIPCAQHMTPKQL
jgi:CheY-like chemotaxis protein